jgi:hypothetical protein
MKTIIAIVYIGVVFAGQAQTNQSIPNSPAGTPGTLTTLNGDTFAGVHIEKVEPIGLVISYQTPGGGLGITTVRFEDLPDAIREKYGFDPKKAATFDAAEKKATADMTQHLIANEQNAKQVIAQREAAEAAAEQQAQEQQKLAAQKAAEAAAIQATNSPNQPRPRTGYSY